MARPDGPIFLPKYAAGSFIQADQKARSRVVVPGKQHGVVHNQRTDGITPSHLGIAKFCHVPTHPDQLAVMRIASDVGIAVRHVHGSLRDGRRIHG